MKKELIHACIMHSKSDDFIGSTEEKWRGNDSNVCQTDGTYSERDLLELVKSLKEEEEEKVVKQWWRKNNYSRKQNESWKFAMLKWLSGMKYDCMRWQQEY